MDEQPIDVHKGIRLLLEACNLYQARALSLNVVLQSILSLSPHERGALTREQVESFVASEREKLSPQSGNTAVNWGGLLSQIVNFP